MTSATHADLILTNGRIYTVDTARPWAQAVAISGGRILAVGSTAEIEAYRTGETEVVDLGGRMAMPGFVDVHNHIMMGGQADLLKRNCPQAPASMISAPMCAVRPRQQCPASGLSPTSGARI